MSSSEDSAAARPAAAGADAELEHIPRHRARAAAPRRASAVVMPAARRLVLNQWLGRPAGPSLTRAQTVVGGCGRSGAAAASGSGPGPN